MFRVLFSRLMLVIVLVFSIIVTLNLAVDPIQYLRKNNGLTYDAGNQRFAYAGIIKNYDFTRLIIGTSMSENFLPSYVDSVFEYGKSLNASISGAIIFEQSMLLQFALREKKISEVIWGIDFFSLSSTEESSLPQYLYDVSRINDCFYLFDPYITRLVFKQIVFRFTNRKSGTFTYDWLTDFWFPQYKHEFSEDIVLEKYKSNKAIFVEQAYDLSTLITNFDRNILDLFQENPETSFYIFFPPYSILYFASILQNSPSSFENLLAFKRYVSEKIEAFDNVFVYDFQDMYDVVENLNNYKDTTHYSLWISESIIESIFSNLKNGIKCRISSENEFRTHVSLALKKYANIIRTTQ